MQAGTAKSRAAGAALAAIVLALWLWGTALAQAGYPPRQDAAINDLAGVLSAADRAEILRARQALLDARGAELVVATIGAVEEYDQSDRSFEAFATGLFNSWGIGDSQRNDGVLLLVAVRDRRVRIELGSGYGSQHNAAMQQVIGQEIVPLMRAGDYGAGVAAGARGIEAVLLGAPAASPGGLRALFSTPIGLLGSGIALVGIGATAYAFWRELRAPRRRCTSCGASMRRLKPPADLAQLNAAQQLESQLGSAQYVVWECRRCGRREPIRTLRYSALDECPACHYHTLHGSAQTLPANKVKGRKQQQQRRIERECRNCSYKDHRTETIALAAASSYAVADQSYSSSSSSYDSSSSSSSSSYDYGSSSSSDSGGSSSGDGASGSW